jgi:hypothetical protein
MLRGLNQRTAVAIVLMGVLLFSVGTCVLPAQHAAHSCCMHMSMPCGSSARTCCAAGPQIPPAVVTPAVSGIAVTAVAEAFLPASVGSVSHDVVTAAVIPSQSPPPGNFILRI